MYRARGVVGISSEVKGLKGGAVDMTRGIGMARMELLNKFWDVLLNCLSRLPCWIVISSPLNLVLKLPSYHLRIQNLLDSILHVAINELGIRRGSRFATRDRIIEIWVKLYNWEYRMESSKRGGKFQLIGHWRYCFDDGIRSNPRM